MIVPEKKIAFIGVTKSGSSSVESYLAQRFYGLEAGRHWREMPEIHDKCLIGAGDKQHWTAIQIKNHILEKYGSLKSWSFFCIYRDPLDRVRSEYNYMKKRVKSSFYETFEDAVLSEHLWTRCYRGHDVSFSKMTQGVADLNLITFERMSGEVEDLIDRITGETSEVRMPSFNAAKEGEKLCITPQMLRTIKRRWWDDFEKRVWKPITREGEKEVKADMPKKQDTPSLETLRLIIKSRRDNFTDEDWDTFETLVAANVDEICEIETWRWLVSISETLAERCPNDETRMLGNMCTLVVLMEKIHAAKYSYHPVTLDKHKPDIIINMMKRLALRDEPAHKMFKTLLNRYLDDPKTLLGWFSRWNTSNIHSIIQGNGQ